MDPKLLPGFGSGIIVPDPDPAKKKRAILLARSITK